jgi:hypothetical protein
MFKVIQMVEIILKTNPYEIYCDDVNGIELGQDRII